MTTVSFDIQITDDIVYEGNEDIKLKIVGDTLPSGVDVGNDQATVTIVDDDGEIFLLHTCI